MSIFLIISLSLCGVLITFLFKKISSINKELHQTQYNLEQFKYSLNIFESILDKNEKLQEKYADKIADHVNGTLSFIELPEEGCSSNSNSACSSGVQEHSDKKN